MIRSLRLTLPLVAAALVLAGCGGDGGPGDDPSSTAEPNATETATTAPTAPSTGSSEPASELPGSAAPGALCAEDELDCGVDIPSEAGGGAADTCLEGATECADNPGNAPPGPPEGTAVEPHPDLVEITATPWESVRPVDDEQTVLEVQWLGGNEACFGLDRVEVEESDVAVSITVYTGRESGDNVCTMEAVRKSTEVELSEPLGPRSILDGADG